MNGRAAFHRYLFLAGPAAACTAALMLFCMLGCTTTDQVLRPQKAEETERERYGVKSTGEYCVVSDLEPKPVGGVGIVTGLDGTGGDSPHDENRTILEKYLVSKGATSANEILNSGKVALVIVSGMIPPGAHVGDAFDIEVSLPRGSKATSLRGGFLEVCRITTYDYARGPGGTGSPLRGHEMAVASGPLQLSLGKTEGDDDGERLTHAHIWEGGRSKIENVLSLMLNPDQQYSHVCNQMATRINETFAIGVTTEEQPAKAVKNMGVALRLPPAYKYNIPHFLRVARLIPMQDPGEQTSDAQGQPKSYRQRLAEDLLDPARTVTAALRLEALGQKSVPALKRGLDSQYPLVRFCAAESLTYLGHSSGVPALAELVEQRPALRAYALSALASLDENVTRAKLEDLMEKGSEPETRYGAFRALRALDPSYPLTRGEQLNRAFVLHRVAPATESLVHITTAKRAEIVLFGAEPRLQPPFAFESNGYTVTAKKDDDFCVVSVVPADGNPIRYKCPLNVNDVLHLMARLDATYPEVVEILIDAANTGRLSCPVALDALPQVASVESLVADGKKGGTMLELGDQELGETPTLYEKAAPKPAPSRGTGTDSNSATRETTGSQE